MDGTKLVEALAREHAEHLRWLAGRHRNALTPEVLEEVLQESYAKAITALGRTPAPTFRDHDAARGWLRRIADNAAIDAVRARDGRRPGSRPQTVELEDADAHPADPEAEEALLGEAERDHGVHVIARAIRELPDHYQRILRWRYRNGMEPQAIARLERISPRSYEGRHYRAMAALREAVAGLDLGTGLRRDPPPAAPAARRAVRPARARPRRDLHAVPRVRAPAARRALARPALAHRRALELMIRPAHGGAAAKSAPATKAGSAHGATWAKAVAGAAATTVAAAGATAAIAAGGAQPAITPSALGRSPSRTAPPHAAAALREAVPQVARGFLARRPLREG